MSRRTFLSRVRAWANSHANLPPPRVLRLAFEPLEDHRLLSWTTWTIDPAESFLSLAIADQVVNYDGTDITLRVRNPKGGDSGSWNEGNSAAIARTLRDRKMAPRRMPAEDRLLVSSSFEPNTILTEISDAVAAARP